MSHYTNVRNRAASCETAPPFAPFTGVRLWYDDEQYFFAGDETGRVLEADNPWATQSMAESVLASISGYSYQPFEAGSAILDPAAELGDGVNVGGVYGPLASITTRFDAMCAADIAAPADEEIDHEYPYLSPAEREYKRNKARTYSLISKTSEEIRLEVHSLRTSTDLALEELSKEIDEELGWLSGEFTETLKQYSTIDQTAEKIDLAVSTSKVYTDKKTGAVAAKLAKYSTIEQTAEKIELAVKTSKEYTNNKTGEVVTSLEKYSTIEQTAEKIELAVKTSKEYTNNKTGEVVTSLEKYSTIDQTAEKIDLAVTGLQNESQVNSLISQAMDKIELSVSSSEGSTSLKLTSNGVEIDTETVDLSVKALNISGLIQAEQIKLKGSITWDDLTSEAKSRVDQGKGEDNPDYIETSYIGETKIMSPSIYGGQFYATGQGAYGEPAYYIYNGCEISGGDADLGELLGYISYDNNGAGTDYEAEERVFFRTLDDVALKLHAGGNMSIEADGGFVYFASKIRAGGGLNIRDIFGTSLPSVGEKGDIFFLLE
jgi:hypothetical protein